MGFLGTLGSVLGGIAGTALLPGIGTAAGSALGGGLGSTVEGLTDKEDKDKQRVQQPIQPQQQHQPINTGMGVGVAPIPNMAYNQASLINPMTFPNMGGQSVMGTFGEGGYTDFSSEESNSSIKDKKDSKKSYKRTEKKKDGSTVTHHYEESEFTGNPSAQPIDTYKKGGYINPMKKDCECEHEGKSQKYAKGGRTKEGVLINIEKNELLTDKEGDIIKEFNAPPHPKQGIDPRGNEIVPEESYVIPDKDAEAFKEMPKEERIGYMSQLPNADQDEELQEKNAMMNGGMTSYKRGGKISMPKKEFQEEHKRLVNVLYTGTDEEQREEGKLQEEELEEEGYKKGGWIQKATASIKRRGTEGVCTGSKFGSSSCPPGSKRYNLAKTFKKMARNRKHEEGGYINPMKYENGGYVNDFDTDDPTKKLQKELKRMMGTEKILSDETMKAMNTKKVEENTGQEEGALILTNPKMEKVNPTMVYLNPNAPHNQTQNVSKTQKGEMEPSTQTKTNIAQNQNKEALTGNQKNSLINENQTSSLDELRKKFDYSKVNDENYMGEDSGVFDGSGINDLKTALATAKNKGIHFVRWNKQLYNTGILPQEQYQQLFQEQVNPEQQKKIQQDWMQKKSFVNPIQVKPKEEVSNKKEIPEKGEDKSIISSSMNEALQDLSLKTPSVERSYDRTKFDKSLQPLKRGQIYQGVDEDEFNFRVKLAEELKKKYPNLTWEQQKKMIHEAVLDRKKTSKDTKKEDGGYINKFADGGPIDLDEFTYQNPFIREAAKQGMPEGDQFAPSNYKGLPFEQKGDVYGGPPLANQPPYTGDKTSLVNPLTPTVQNPQTGSYTGGYKFDKMKMNPLQIGAAGLSGLLSLGTFAGSFNPQEGKYKSQETDPRFEALTNEAMARRKQGLTGAEKAAMEQSRANTANQQKQQLTDISGGSGANVMANMGNIQNMNNQSALQQEVADNERMMQNIQNAQQMAQTRDAMARQDIESQNQTYYKNKVLPKLMAAKQRSDAANTITGQMGEVGNSLMKYKEYNDYAGNINTFLDNNKQYFDPQQSAGFLGTYGKNPTFSFTKRNKFLTL